MTLDCPRPQVLVKQATFALLWQLDPIQMTTGLQGFSVPLDTTAPLVLAHLDHYSLPALYSKLDALLAPIMTKLALLA